MSPFLLPPPVLSGHYCVAWDLCNPSIPVPTRDQAGVLAVPVDFLSAETAKWRGTRLPRMQQPLNRDLQPESEALSSRPEDQYQAFWSGAWSRAGEMVVW